MAPLMRHCVFIVCAALAASLCGVEGGTVVAETFDTLDDWRVVSVGPAAMRLEEGGVAGRYLRVESRSGLAFCSRELPVEALRGTQVTIRCMTLVDAVTPGPQVWSAPKIHLAAATPEGPVHFSTRLSQPTPWQQVSLLADVPVNASRILLSLGVESAAATVGFDSLLVLDQRRDVRSLDLSPVANFALAGLPNGVTEADDLSFAPVGNGRGQPAPNCIALRGNGHDELPRELNQPLRAGVIANTVYFLHAVLGDGEARETPCVIWTARFWDGQEASFSVFEGRDVGGLGSSQDLANWKVVWRGKTADGRVMALGVTAWRLYAASVPLESLSPRAYAGAAPVIAAITVVAEPPPEDTADEGNEWMDGWPQ